MPSKGNFKSLGTLAVIKVIESSWFGISILFLPVVAISKSYEYDKVAFEYP